MRLSPHCCRLGFNTLAIASAFLYLGSLAPLAAQPEVCQQQSPIKVIDLKVNASAEEIDSARKMYAQGHVIRVHGPRKHDLERLLGIKIARVESTTERLGPECSWLPRNARKSNPETEALRYVAVRSSMNGSLHQFLGFIVPKGSHHPHQSQRAFSQWVDRERARACASGLTTLPPELSAAEDPQPPMQAWTELSETTNSAGDDGGDASRSTIAVYRLNDVDEAYDWYMVLSHPQVQPNFQGCSSFPINCQELTFQRVVTLQTQPTFILFNHGPSTQVSVVNVSFSIGGSLNQTGPGVSARFGESWQQPSVNTLDQSSLSQNLAQWTENFLWPINSYSPAPTSSSIFLSHQGAIFQVPEGTKEFDLATLVDLTFGQEINVGGVGQQSIDQNTIGQSISLAVQPPVFSVTPAQITIAPGGQGTVQLDAYIPASTNGLSWVVTNIPTWLTVSQTSGSASTSLTLSVSPDAPPGAVGSPNFNTNPAFGAPSVERGALPVTVTVGSSGPPCDPPLWVSQKK